MTMAKSKRPKGLGSRMRDFYFEMEDPEGNAPVIDGSSTDKAAKESAEGPRAEGDDGIDWDLVNREAAIGVELNRKAMTLWKKQQGDQRSSRRSDEQFNS
jgi:hypothetical protein